MLKYCLLLKKNLLLCFRSPCVPNWMGCENGEQIKSYLWNKAWSTCTRQACDSVKIQWCGCCACAKIFIKNNIFYWKPGENFLVKIIGERRYSHTLNQGGMELPATYIYRSADIDIHSTLLILVEETMEVWNKGNNKEKTKLSTKQKNEKDTSRK